MISFIIGFMLGSFTGMMIMACIQINKGDEEYGESKEDK